MANDWLIPFISLASMRRTERSRATEPMMLTMIPGPAAQRTAFGAVAVADQARSGLRRERRVAEQTVTAFTTAAADPDNFTVETLRQQPALRPIANEALTGKIKSAATNMASLAGQGPELVKEAADLAAVLVDSSGKKLSVAEAEDLFPTLLAQLSAAQKKKIVTLP